MTNYFSHGAEEAMEFKLCTMVIKAVRRGVATDTDYCLTLKRLKREARRRLKNVRKTSNSSLEQ
jgi:hypothetical protein